MKLHLAENRARRALVVTALYLLGIVCFQIAWIVGVMPFGQMDEIDHAYRAASVAQGHITDRSESSNARGDVIRVPATLVASAHDTCTGFKYLKPGNCTPMSASNAQGDVLVGSGAARYNPVYYAVVGVPAVTLFPHSGTAMLYTMRIITALWVDLLLALGVYVTALLARRAWPLAAVLIASMPVLLCASTAVAPNGVQMAGGLLMWCGLGPLVTHSGDLSAKTRRYLIGIAAFGAIQVLVTHSTGPLWVGLSAIAVVIALGRRRTTGLLRANPRSWAAAVAAVGFVGIASGAWTVLQGANLANGDDGHFGHPTLSILAQPIVWIAQCVAAVPFREQFAPLPTIAAGVGALGFVLVLAFRRGSRQTRLALAFIVLATLGASLALDASTFSSLGNAWQGRYTLAFSFGLPLLAGWALDRGQVARRSAATSQRVVVTMGVVCALINAITIVTMFETYERPWWTRTELADEPPLALLVVLAVAGALFIASAAVAASRAIAAREVVESSTAVGEPIPASA